MSWSDRLTNTQFIITTGDGQVFRPLWKSGDTRKEYNAAIFEYIDMPGSFIDRRQVRARSFPLVFWFQGDDNIELADAFDRAANDPRAWRVQHPFYGDITGQPLSIARNDQNYNVTEISVDFWETITRDLPAKTVSPADNTLAQAIGMGFTGSIEYAGKTDLKPVDISKTRLSAQKIDLSLSRLLTSDTYAAYQLQKNKTFASIDKLTTAPEQAIKDLYTLVQQPANFSVSVNSRLNILKSVYNELKSVLTFRSTPNDKAYFEVIAGAVISAMAMALVTPVQGDYVTRNQVALATADMTDTYQDYRKLQDDLYVPMADQKNHFAAGHDLQNDLYGLVLETAGGMNTVAFNAKQQRIALLDRDSNLIILTNRYLGLDADDAKLDQFRELNNIKNKSLFRLRKGRQIKYLV